MTTTKSTGAGGVAAHHNEWLALVEVSGPFLTLPVLKRALPQGLEPTEPDLARQLRLAYDEWQHDPALHHRWVRWVFTDVLDFDDTMLAEGPALPPQVIQRVGEHGVTLRPDLAVLDPAYQAPRLLVRILPRGTELDDPVEEDRWAATPRERMVELCRHSGVRLGLVTNGATWTLVDAPVGGPSAFATWEAPIWLDERLSLDAFRTLLSAHRFFAVAETDTLEALLAESAEAEQEVTDQLGYQVRQAVELLVDAFGRADRNAGGQLLRGVPAEVVYEAAVTVMMRTVFLLAAEERDLLPLADPLYQGSYAVSPLRGQLREQADQYGEEPLERRSTAWHRLLATFRMVYAGVAHENLRLPAYGGSLFDPDRFPFLEGRQPDEAWQADPGRPLPVDDRTVLAILDAVQVLQFHYGRGVKEARRLSFRALDVEQIGHVYEGLLDHTAYEAQSPVLGLAGKHEAELAAEDLTAYDVEEDREELIAWLKEQTGLTQRQAEKRLDADVDPEERGLLLAACDNDEDLAAELELYAGLLRRDLRGLPQVWLPGSVYVTSGSERRTTGTYYTPRVLAEEMVQHTLAPLCYQPGPADGAEPDDWQLRPARELLDLRVCDMAMGSGAFLVAACRYLADRVMEAWHTAEATIGGEVTIFGEAAADAPDAEVVPADADDRRLLARRVVVDRSLFGVDKNPMAVEMAKLSMWLITLAKDRPFSFLDHALRCGDSLLGVTDLAQLEHLHPNPARGRELHEGTLFDYQAVWAPLVKEAIEKRRRLESFTVVTVGDAEEKARLHHEARDTLDALRVIGDVVMGAAITTANQDEDVLDGQLADSAEDVAKALDPNVAEADRAVRLEDLRNRAQYWLDTDRPSTVLPRRALHWPLEFPEIFLDRAHKGFDAILSNPPFRSGVELAGDLGVSFERFLKARTPESKGFVDLSAYFHRRANELTPEAGVSCLLGPSTLTATANKQAAIQALLDQERTIWYAKSKMPWPGSANLDVCIVLYGPSTWSATPKLDDQYVNAINGSLAASIDLSRLERLRPWLPYSEGTHLYGSAFVRQKEDWESFLWKEPRLAEYLRAYLNADSLCNSPDFTTDKLAVDFGELDKDELPHVQETVEHLEREVGRERAGQTRQVHEYRPWLFWDKRTKSYEEARKLERVLVVPNLSKHVPMAFVDSKYLFSKGVKFFITDDPAVFAILQSSVFVRWVERTSQKRSGSIAFSTRNSFDTFVPPSRDDDRLYAVGSEHWNARMEVMESRKCGLTHALNLMHDPDQVGSDVVRLREAHQAADQVVLECYGWGDLASTHEYMQTPYGLRLSMRDDEIAAVLERLVRLNAEAAQGGGKQGGRTARSAKKRPPGHGFEQPGLAGME